MTAFMAPPHPSLEHFADLTVELGPIQEMGRGRGGQRRIIPIIGGVVSGPHVSGRVLNIGADWQTIFVDGLAELDTRYGIETDDGAVIEIINYGLRHGPEDVMTRLAAGESVDPSSYYMRTHARLETGHPDYLWVNKLLFVGTGVRHASAVNISLYVLR